MNRYSTTDVQGKPVFHKQMDDPMKEACRPLQNFLESVNSSCEQNSFHGPLLQHAACAVEETVGTVE